jgi:hypothetical protein
MALGTFESDRTMRGLFQGFNPGLGQFGAVASDDAKGAFSHGLDALKKQIKDGAGADIIYVQADRQLQDLARYDSWDSSWAPVSLGGYYSFQEIKSELERIKREFPKSRAREVARRTSGPAASADPVAAATDPTKYALPQVMEAPDTCEQKALDRFGPILGLSTMAQTLTCHTWKVVIGAVVLLVGIIAIYGFASGLGRGAVAAVL